MYLDFSRSTKKGCVIKRQNNKCNLYILSRSNSKLQSAFLTYPLCVSEHARKQPNLQVRSGCPMLSKQNGFACAEN